jgi:hypothetical protein
VQNQNKINDLEETLQLTVALDSKKVSYLYVLHTDKKENQIFLIYREIQSGASPYMGKYFRISSYIRKSYLIYDFATAPL